MCDHGLSILTKKEISPCLVISRNVCEDRGADITKQPNQNHSRIIRDVLATYDSNEHKHNSIEK